MFERKNLTNKNRW